MHIFHSFLINQVCMYEKETLLFFKKLKFLCVTNSTRTILAKNCCLARIENNIKNGAGKKAPVGYISFINFIIGKSIRLNFKMKTCRCVRAVGLTDKKMRDRGAKRYRECIERLVKDTKILISYPAMALRLFRKRNAACTIIFAGSIY